MPMAECPLSSGDSQKQDPDLLPSVHQPRLHAPRTPTQDDAVLLPAPVDFASSLNTRSRWAHSPASKPSCVSALSLQRPQGELTMEESPGGQSSAVFTRTCSGLRCVSDILCASLGKSLSLPEPQRPQQDLS